jgi:hypothetical protein
VGALSTKEGRSVVTADGLAVVADRPDQIRRLNAALSAAYAAPDHLWQIQLCRITRRCHYAGDAGLSGTAGAGAFIAALQAGVEAGAVDAMIAPSLLLREGSRVAYNDGARIPYQQTVTQSDAGGRTTSQTIQWLETGLILSATCRSGGSPGAALVSVDYSRSSAINYRSDLPPETLTEQFRGDVAIREDCAVPLQTLTAIDSGATVGASVSVRPGAVSWTAGLPAVSRDTGQSALVLLARRVRPGGGRSPVPALEPGERAYLDDAAADAARADAARAKRADFERAMDDAKARVAAYEARQTTAGAATGQGKQ